MNVPRPLTLLIVCLALITAACGGDADETATAAPTTVAPPPPTVEATTPTPTPVETTPPVTYALTGVEASDDAALSRPALGVKVDNSPSARPQVGLGEADVVFEELVEGGITRFLAVYNSQDPGTVGPVRSGRDVDADLFPPFSGILGISGAAGPTYNVLRSAGLTVFEEGQADGAIYRVPDRAAPHNLMADTAKLWSAAEGQSAAPMMWTFSSEVPEGGTPSAGVSARFSQEYGHTWVWSDEDSAWIRGQNGTRHVTADGEQISAENVVYASVSIGGGGGVDVNGAGTVSVNLEGTGPATFLRDGQVFTGTWSKSGRGEPFVWFDSSGVAFPLAPGRTFVELQPSAFSVTSSDDPSTLSALAPTVAEESDSE